MNKAVRNWRLMWMLSKFYVEPHYPRDLKALARLIITSQLYPSDDEMEDKKVDIDFCPNCGNWTRTHFKRRITMGKESIRCDILGRSDSAFFCDERCILEYSRKNPTLRITTDPD